MARLRVEQNQSVPQTPAEAAKAVFEVGKLQRAISSLEEAMDAEAAKVREKFASDILPLKARLEETVVGLRSFAEAHKSDILATGAKSMDLGTGRIGFRLTPPKVTILEAAGVIIERLKALGLTRFIRVKEELDKRSLLADKVVAESVTGVTITQEEEFIVEPATEVGQKVSSVVG